MTLKSEQRLPKRKLRGPPQKTGITSLSILHRLSSPATFAIRASHGRWKEARHLKLLNEVLLDVAAGKIKRLIVNMPPRHGKSEFISKYFPAWYLGTFPDRRVILVSYEADFAASWGRKARDLLEAQGKITFHEEIGISGDSSSAARWDIDGHDGGMMTAGVGGPITGKGGHLIIIDDPVKNDEQAMSKTYREKAKDWYKSTLYTRLEPGGAIILIGTRWHKDDLSGYLIKEMDVGGETWVILNLPAIAGNEDPLGRVPGEALWPERFSLEQLRKIKKAVHEYWWNCLYMQTPGDPEGGKFKRAYFRYWERSDDGEFYVLHHPNGDRRVHTSTCTIFQTCDPAGSAKTTADYFVLATWALTPNKELLLLDIIREHLEGPDQPDLFQNGFRRWHPVQQGVEVKAMGLTLFQTLERLGLPVIDLDPGTQDKMQRALPMAARYKTNMVYHPLNKSEEIDIYEEELVAFPNAPHDDCVDVASYAFVMMQDIGSLPKSWSCG